MMRLITTLLLAALAYRLGVDLHSAWAFPIAAAAFLLGACPEIPK